MLDLEVTTEVADAIAEIGHRSDRPLTIEGCTTPELRMEFIALWLEREAPPTGGIDGFRMGSWKDEVCGTMCCIGGSANFWFGGEQGRRYTANSERAAKILGLPESAAKELFYPTSGTGGIIASADHAARCIRNYQKTGVVDWKGTR
jgi:hypothetical protein